MAATLRSTVIFLCLATDVAKFETFTRNYEYFNQSMIDPPNPEAELKAENSATVSNGALQITPDTSNPSMFNYSYRTATFKTHFLVIMYPVPSSDSSPGEGLAFLIAPTIDIPAESYGPYLGLTSPSTDDVKNNGIVAVELDTVKQSFDPDNNHIGLNVHSIISVVTKSLTPLNITLAPPTPTFHNVWIQYNGTEEIIRVYIADQPERTSSTYPTYPKKTNHRIQSRFKENWLLVLGAYLGYYLYKKRLVERSNSYILSRLKTLPGMPKEFQFKELKKATNNFDEKRKLGQGGFGVVYHGLLSGDNVEVAVKWFSRESLKGEYDFLAELTIINRLRHKHLVQLLGEFQTLKSYMTTCYRWCHKNGKLLLVYEYMQKGSLDMHLFTKTGNILSWTLRCQILAGVASALNYLHYEYDQKVVHRDIKASNIMLDSHFNARLGDFGLARALDNEKTSYAEAEGVIGTIGYIAPECFLTGKATQYSDIYAFGALLIEVVSGKRPGTRMNGFQFMVDYVWSLYREGHILDVVDERIQDDYDKEEAERLLLLGLACSHPMAVERPQTQAIVQILSGTLAAPRVPPFKPAFVWPAMMPIDEISESTSIDTTSIDTTPFSINQF
ncbi:concanavalin A-like lectin/glucanase domain, Serine/threonine-protein kinase Mps1 [Artemisia annua]|uniref:non-specific serine/threonine protein kinase n=1 Tax=Artemisia annua TaxID=35608 RepID=A0A2U1LFB9_ARTAN|nr:concanavalin A-like lectin/glucanase domain, Serine/threonine-protein kinase Mps1 [Artemisia annua]